MPDTETLTPLEEIQLELELGMFDPPDDGDDFAHYVGKDRLVEAMIEGNYVQALCGWMFIPTRDPQKFPVCQKCKDINEMLPA